MNILEESDFIKMNDGRYKLAYFLTGKQVDKIIKGERIIDKIENDIVGSGVVNTTHTIVCDHHCCSKWDRISFEKYLRELLTLDGGSNDQI